MEVCHDTLPRQQRVAVFLHACIEVFKVLVPGHYALGVCDAQLGEGTACTLGLHDAGRHGCKDHCNGLRL